MDSDVIQAGGIPRMLRRRTRLGAIWRTVLDFTRRKPLGAAGALVVIVLIIVAVFAPVLAPMDPYVMHSAHSFAPPSSQFLLGTDIFGRDQLSRIIYGARISLYVGFLSVLMGTGVGVLLGITSAYLGGKFDLVVQRLVDTVMGFPGLVLVIVLVVSLGATLFNITAAIAFTYSARVVRLSRSSALSVKEEPYVLAATAIGASTKRIIFRHVTPNCLAPLFVLASQQLGAAIVIEASLSFLGLGVPPSTPSWGNMLQLAAENNMQNAPWLAIFPGLALSIVVFAFAMFGDALRDVLDPRLRGT